MEEEDVCDDDVVMMMMVMTMVMMTMTMTMTMMELMMETSQLGSPNFPDNYLGRYEIIVLPFSKLLNLGKVNFFHRACTCIYTDIRNYVTGCWGK